MVCSHEKQKRERNFSWVAVNFFKNEISRSNNNIRSRLRICEYYGEQSFERTWYSFLSHYDQK